MQNQKWFITLENRPLVPTLMKAADKSMRNFSLSYNSLHTGREGDELQRGNEENQETAEIRKHTQHTHYRVRERNRSGESGSISKHTVSIFTPEDEQLLRYLKAQEGP